MLNEKLSEYQAIVIEVNKLEKQIQDFFNLLAVRENPKFDRCADYGQRFINIMIPFDEVNVDCLKPEKTEKIIQIISQYRELRKRQKNVENEVNEFNAIHNNIKDTLML